MNQFQITGHTDSMAVKYLIWLLDRLTCIAAATLSTILVSCALVACASHPSHIYADRVFTDEGHTYRAYRNDKQAVITHDGGCKHPIHFCEQRKTP